MINFPRLGWTVAGVGRLGRATRRWARQDGLPVAAGVLVELAKDAADLADRYRGKDDRLYLAAAVRLQQLIAAVDRVAGRDGGGGASERGASGRDGEWGRLVGAEPDAVVDAEDAGA